MNGIEIPVSVIKETVADLLNVTVEQMESTCRKREFVKPRHIAMYCLNKYTDLSLAKIAWEFHREHCDVIHARKSINGQLDIYKDFRAELSRIMKILEKKVDIDFDDYKQFDTDKV
jgi:chromosomal replication initiation ATPase DnaA